MKTTISFLSIFLITYFFSSVYAQKNVKISTIGAVTPAFDKSLKPQEIVNQILKFWSDELQQVLPDQPDLIVLPEACDRPKHMPSKNEFEFYKVRKNQILDYFRVVAKDNHCYIAFGMKHQIEDGSWRNSVFLLDRLGETVGVYDKNFPTIGEMKLGIKPGTEIPIFQCDFGTIAAAICFDLNFNELRMRFAKLKPDIIVFPSMYHGGIEQANWAYSCRSYFVGSIGQPNLPSEIRNPMGEIIASSSNYFDFITTEINLDYCLVHLDNNWAKLRKLKEKYGEDVIISDPGKIGAVLLTSEHKNMNIEEMVKEFEITLLDDYFNDSRKYKKINN